MIQTMSILIQNIHNQEESFYLFSHPFLNKLISYNFDLNGNNEVVDYFISFLKMLSLQLNESTVQFFFNSRFKDFPLYGVATSLYNHSEPMVRTAARTITLTVYNVCTDEMLESILSLPHATYFPNLACQLRKIWKKIDDSLMHDLNFEDMRDEIEDIKDLLMYFQDIFNTGIPQLNRALTNSLLYYAYLPCLIGSLRTSNPTPEIKSYSAAIFFLNQTYCSIHEPTLSRKWKKMKDSKRVASFINTLSVALFLPHIPEQFESWINTKTKTPLSYSEKYTRKVMISNLCRYTEENLSLANLNLFINNNWSFLNEIQEEYKELKRLYCTTENEVISDENIELKQKGIQLIANHLKAKEVSRIDRYHTQLSVALGRSIGMREKDSEYDLMSPSDYTEMILKAMHQDRYNKFIMYQKYVPNESAQVLLNFLRSKDDSLVLLIASLLYSYMISEAVDPTIHFFSKFYPIGKLTASNPEELSDENEEFKSPHDSDELLNSQNNVNSKLRKDSKIDEFNEKVLMTYDQPQYDQEIV